MRTTHKNFSTKSDPSEQGNVVLAGRERIPGQHLFPFPWQKERAARLHRICSSIAGRVERGQTFRRSLRWFRWYYLDAAYRCQPSRRFRLAKGTLRRLYYIWKQGGRTPAAFALYYRPGRAKLNPALVSRFAKICLHPEITTYRAAQKKLGVEVTQSAFTHALPVQLRKQISALFCQRRTVERTRKTILKRWRLAR